MIDRFSVLFTNALKSLTCHSAGTWIRRKSILGEGKIECQGWEKLEWQHFTTLHLHFIMPWPLGPPGSSRGSPDHLHWPFKHNGRKFLVFYLHITSGLVCWLLPGMVAHQAVNRQAVEWISERRAFTLRLRVLWLCGLVYSPGSLGSFVLRLVSWVCQQMRSWDKPLD